MTTESRRTLRARLINGKPHRAVMVEASDEIKELRERIEALEAEQKRVLYIGAAMQDQTTLNRDFTIQEVCEVFRCTPPTVYKLMNSGKLESYTVGRSRRITYESIERVRKSKATA